MPFGCDQAVPSIQLGLLQAIAKKAGFPTDTYPLYLDLAQRLSPEVYAAAGTYRRHLTGEWLFSVAAFGPQAHGPDDVYFRAFPPDGFQQEVQKDVAYLSSLRHEILPRFIDDCLSLTDWGQYRVVGFSSCFQQNVASLALARRIKERYPAVTILFGGANVEGEMGPEHVRAFPFLDFVVVGEGDEVFPALLRRLAAGQDPGDLPGVASRGPQGVRFAGQAPPVRDLDALPVPTYDDYFRRAQNLGLLKPGQLPWTLPFESSRGCWWGARRHCTFCGLNGLGMAYRAKSPDRLLAELAELSRRHQACRFTAVDNILDLKYVREVFARLQEARTDYELFYEVKANLTREQIRGLYRAGVRVIQPGIESLSSHVLRLMRKGCTMLQNIRLLKWCAYYGITASWNLIWGFPGETEEDYRQELEVLQRLSHLQPPTNGPTRIGLDRFAPYFFDRARFPVEDVRPQASYGYIYPAHVDLEKLAYFFDYRMGQTTAEEAHRQTRACVDEWQRRWQSGRRDTLVYRRTPHAVLIDDRRGPGQGRLHTCRGPWALAYEFCSETMRTAAQVAEHLGAAPDGFGVSEETIAAALEDFCRKGLMLGEDGQYLSLALPVNPNW
jgi:ribosomal peptide maturation radical SAM protein 1